MANEQNLIPQAHILTVEEQSKGGKKSGEVRRERKTVQTLLNDLLDQDIIKSKKFKSYADKLGLKSDQSIKELVTAMCILNTMTTGDVNELQKLARLLGEENENQGVLDKLDAVLKGIDEVIDDEQP